jgi:hypothetical protein
VKTRSGGQRAGSTSTVAAPSVAQAAPKVTPTQVTPPTPQQVAAGNVLPNGGVAFSDFEKMTDDQKADVITKALGVGTPMFLDDSGMQKFAYYTGMSDKPTVVSDSQLDGMKGTELFRGVRDAYIGRADIGYSSQDIVKQIREGDYTMYSDSGGSVHGKAIYFGTDFRTASSYAQSGMNARNPIVMRAKLTGGKTISESKARSDYQSALRKGEKLALACSNAGYDSAVNLYTLAKGYDAIQGGYTMVLNRRCLTVSDQTRNARGRSSW